MGRIIQYWFEWEINTHPKKEMLIEMIELNMALFSACYLNFLVQTK